MTQEEMRDAVLGQIRFLTAQRREWEKQRVGNPHFDDLPAKIATDLKNMESWCYEPAMRMLGRTSNWLANAVVAVAAIQEHILYERRQHEQGLTDWDGARHVAFLIEEDDEHTINHIRDGHEVFVELAMHLAPEETTGLLKLYGLIEATHEEGAPYPL